MRKQVSYEWTLEEVEEGDIVNSDFSDTLSFPKEAIQGKDLGLVRNEGSEAEGVTDRLWAYVKEGKLPEYFSNSLGQSTLIKVPQKYHEELKKYFSH